MKWVAAFAVSAYGYCNDRAGHKPFNPLLGETYECVRDDKGFKYIAEQVKAFITSTFARLYLTPFVDEIGLPSSSHHCVSCPVGTLDMVARLSCQN